MLNSVSQKIAKLLRQRVGCWCPGTGGGAAGVGAAPCWAHSAPVDPLQGTVEPLRQDGGTSGKTYLRKTKNATRAERSEEKSGINSPADTKARGVGGGGGAPGARAEVPLQPL